MSAPSVLDETELMLITIAVLVKRLGGRATITQEDVNIVAHNRLMERHHGNGEIEFFLEEHERTG